MSSIVYKISAPIKSELVEFEDKFEGFMRSKVPLLNRIMYYIIRRKGKQIRPMFVFLCAKITGEITQKTYRAACLIELLHTATLVHDDIVDDSNIRRGFFSINALWKNKVGVLVGDYLLSKCLLLSVDHGDFDLLKTISESIKHMSEGELLQIEKTRRLDITEQVYYEIVEKKTATLISSCCAVGAQSVETPPEVVEKMALFGKYIGIAFQIKDDLFDYKKTSITGKPIGIDIKEQKMTLPLIYILQSCEKKDKNWILNVVKKHHLDRQKISEVIRFIQDNGGVDYAIDKMKSYRDKALKIISDFPQSECKKSLELLINHVIDRDK